MSGKNSAEVPNMRQRTVLQHLSLADWRWSIAFLFRRAKLPWAGYFTMVGLRADVKSNVLRSDSPRRGSRRRGRGFEAIHGLVRNT